jgi:tripartite-type tricarboxylate transporter receptor subunit TctC
MHRREFMAGALALPMLAKAGLARAESGPLSKIIFPFAAGGGGDGLCRQLAQYLPPILDRNVIVENRTGGDGLIGIRAVKGASNDGTTILVTTGPTMYLLPMVETEPSFDTANDFVPVSQVTRFEFALVTSPSIDARDFAQLVAWLRANPAKASYGVPSNGTIPHFTGWQLEQILKLSMTRVPYRGSAVRHHDARRRHHAASRRRRAHRCGEQRVALALPERRADLEGKRRRSRRRRLVWHVAAGRQLARFCEEAQRRRR